MWHDTWGCCVPQHYQLNVFSFALFQAESCARLLPYSELPPSPLPRLPCHPDAGHQWPEAFPLADLLSWAHAHPASVPACLWPVLRAEPFWPNPQLLWRLPGFSGCLSGGPAPRPPQLPWHGVFWVPEHSGVRWHQGMLKGPNSLIEGISVEVTSHLSILKRSSLRFF